MKRKNAKAQSYDCFSWRPGAIATLRYQREGKAIRFFPCALAPLRLCVKK